MTTEQKAWQLWENGVTFAEITMTSLVHDCSSDHAIELLWDSKLGKNNLMHSTQPTIHESGIEIGCCHGK